MHNYGFSSKPGDITNQPKNKKQNNMQKRLHTSVSWQITLTRAGSEFYSTYHQNDYCQIIVVLPPATAKHNT